MAKGTAFVCTECGTTHSKWAGRCDACGAWNTIVEDAGLTAGPAGKSLGKARGARSR
jgi:DNA repair protein RadA/Sms